ncbi:MAG: signal peptidase II [Acidobacteriota bacterium]|nr:signal peptidase II [Acidobacteriota bacterium]
MSSGKLRALYFGIAAAVIAADRFTKIMVAKRIELDFGSVTLIPRFFSLTHVENTGAAFSMFADWPAWVRVPLLVAFSTAAMILVSVLLWRMGKKFSRLGLALSFILGGAVGNLYDRARFGRVTDFLHVYVGTHTWPDFNLADSAIVCGACLLVLDLFLSEKQERAQ